MKQRLRSEKEEESILFVVDDTKHDLHDKKEAASTIVASILSIIVEGSHPPSYHHLNLFL